MTTWHAALGAVVARGQGTSFRVWAPMAKTVHVSIDRGGTIDERPLSREADGIFSASYEDIGAGHRYGYRLDRGSPLPDPASRFQPDGVHGASLTVDPPPVSMERRNLARHATARLRHL